MKSASIFLSEADGYGFADFEHDGTIYSFRHLTCRGVERLVDGPCHFFVTWVMAECSGLELVRRLRADRRFAESPITMILEREDGDDMRRALRSGADSYMLGPVVRNAILDRVLLSGVGPDADAGGSLLDFGKLVINPGAHRATWLGKPIEIPPNELRLLRFMAENANRVLSREELIRALGKDGGDLSHVRTVDVWIKRLRGGLRSVGGDAILRTVQGRGYVLDLDYA